MCKRVFAIVAVLLAVACHRERRYEPDAPSSQRAIPIRVGSLQPGPKLGNAEYVSQYEGNAHAISEGQRLFEQYNCAGCHFHGGGGIGPALMDGDWVYGNSPTNIYASITQGRPNGMPSFGGHIPDYQVWELVAYVRSLGGLQARGATPVRTDDLQAKRTEESH